MIVIYGGGPQTISHIVSEIVGSATFEILDLTRDPADAARGLQSGAAIVPAWTLTLSGDAGPRESDASLIPVSSIVGAVLEPGIITATDGRREPISIAAIGPTYVKSSSLLAGTYGAGATVEGSRLTTTTIAAVHDFEDALDDQRPLAISWSYTTAAGPIVVTEPLELLRGNRAAVSTGPAVDSLLRGWPDLKGRLLEGLTIDDLAAFTLEQLIAEFSIRGQDHASLMHGDPGRMLLVAAILDQAARRGYAPGLRPLAEFAAEAHDDYSRQLEALTTGAASSQAIGLDTDHQSHQRPDQRQWGPLLSL